MKNKRKIKATPLLKRFKLEQEYYSNLCPRKQIAETSNISKCSLNNCLRLYDVRNIQVSGIIFSNIHKKKFNFDLYKDEVIDYIKSYLKEATSKKLPMLSAKKITLHLLEKHPEIDYSFHKVRNYIMPLKRQFLDKQRKYIPLTR